MKNFLDILKRNNSGIGFNSNSNHPNDKLLIFGKADNIDNEAIFKCDAYIYSKKPTKSSNYTGKFISKEDQIEQINKTDFIVINKIVDKAFEIGINQVSLWSVKNSPYFKVFKNLIYNLADPCSRNGLDV